MLANSVTKPAGTTMLSRVLPIWYDIGRWRMAVSGPCLRKDRSGESTAFGDGGGASGRTVMSVALRTTTRSAVSGRVAIIVSRRAGTAAAGGVGTTVGGRPGATVAVRARANVSA